MNSNNPEPVKGNDKQDALYIKKEMMDKARKAIEDLHVTVTSEKRGELQGLDYETKFYKFSEFQLQSFIIRTLMDNP